jgi:DNA-binding CsgD family transcriptional regulator
LKYYMTIRDASEKWGVSQRRVNQFCTEGRIDGAHKIGGVWAIPANASRPQDPRKSKNVYKLHWNTSNITLDLLMPLLNTAFKPGQCMQTIDAMEDGLGKQIALAEYNYFTGKPEEAVRLSESLLDCENMIASLSGCFIYTFANISLGEISKAKKMLETVSMALDAVEKERPEFRVASAFVATASAVLLHLPLPEKMSQSQAFLHLLPTGLRAFALYVQAHYMYLQGEYEKSAGLVEGVLAMEGESYIIPAIYLHLVAVMNYMSMRNLEKSREHMLAAWELARPDDLIEGLGEHHGLLGGMLESVIKKDWPEDFKRIISITYRFSMGWRRVHNPQTGHDVADNLTTTEFAVAMLAARGWTNKEIGEHMNISPNTVKKYISVALKKLNIEQRNDLKKFMLK